MQDNFEVTISVTGKIQGMQWGKEHMALLF